MEINDRRRIQAHSRKGGKVLKVQKLIKPSKKSGFELKPGAKTEMKGLLVVNQNDFSVWVDKFTSPKKRKKKKVKLK